MMSKIAPSINCLICNQPEMTSWKTLLYRSYSKYSKCPKISNTKVSEKMTYANSADPDQTAPKGGQNTMA